MQLQLHNMIRTVTIATQSDLEQTWTDVNCPNMEFGFIEQEIQDCLQDDGTFEATYETLEVPTGEYFSMTYLCADTNSTKTYTLRAGEYGVKPA